MCTVTLVQLLASPLCAASENLLADVIFGWSITLGRGWTRITCGIFVPTHPRRAPHVELDRTLCYVSLALEVVGLDPVVEQIQPGHVCDLFLVHLHVVTRTCIRTDNDGGGGCRWFAMLPHDQAPARFAQHIGFECSQASDHVVLCC